MCNVHVLYLLGECKYKIYNSTICKFYTYFHRVNTKFYNITHVYGFLEPFPWRKSI